MGNANSESLSDSTSEESDDGLGSQEDKVTFAGRSVEEQSVVLHPTESAYAKRYPNFNSFAGQPLIDNGYVDDYNNHCNSMIVHPSANCARIDYMNTLFTASSGEMEE